MRALGEMARGIAHDFNNALNAILGETGVLAALVNDCPAANDGVERLRKVALDGAATIRKVQEFSGQRRDCDFDRVELGRVVAAAADEVRARADGAVTVDVSVTARGIVEGNGEELGELVRVLIDNALEAMPEGGRLTLEPSALGDRDVQLVVTDTGIGMDASVRRRALDPFFTTKGSRKKGRPPASRSPTESSSATAAASSSTRSSASAKAAACACACRPRPPATSRPSALPSPAARPPATARAACSSSRTTPTTARRWRRCCRSAASWSPPPTAAPPACARSPGAPSTSS